jgi:hypothetical protein
MLYFCVLQKRVPNKQTKQTNKQIMKKSSLLIFALSALAAQAQITPSTFSTNASFATGMMPVGIDHADFDGDGKQDVVVTNYYDNNHNTGNAVSVYHNQFSPGVLNNSTFAGKVDFTIKGSPQDVVASDIDSDGKPDLVVANYINPGFVSILRNTCTAGVINAASFAAKVDFGVEANPSAVSVGDIDGDGKPDLVAATNYGISVLRNNSTIGTVSMLPALNSFVGFGFIDVQLGDVDGDGKLDMTAINMHDSTFSVWRNISTIGNIVFEPRVEYETPDSPYGINIADIDGDGKNDILVASAGMNYFSVFRNAGISGSFTPASFYPRANFAAGSTMFSIIAQDLDADGKKEVIIGRQNLGISVYKNNSITGAVAFQAEVNYSYPYAGSTFGLTAFDYDNDGDFDLAGTNYDNNNGRFSVLRNEPIAAVVPDFTFSTTNLVCAGATNGSITLTTTAGTGPFQYSINGGTSFQASNVFNGLAASNYNAVVKNAAGSSAVKAIVLTQPPALTVTTGNNATVYYGYAPQACTTLNAQANGGLPNYTYLWSNGANTATTNVCPSVTTDYTVTVTDANGCTTTSAPVSVCVVDVRCGNNGVSICHKKVVCSKSGKTKNEIVCVPASAVASHLAHGDKLGACVAVTGCKSAARTEAIADEAETGGPSVIVYPNPFSSDATLEFRADASDRTAVEIFNTQGVLVAKIFDAVTEEGEVYHANIDGSQWAKGLYLVKIVSVNGVQNLKLVLGE